MIAESTMKNPGQLDGSWGLMMVVSIILHMAVLAAAIFLSGAFESSENDDIVYEVDLVSMPASVPQSQAVAASKPEVAVSAPAKKALKVEEKKISIPAEKPAISLKKPVVKKEEARVNNVDTAIARLQKKVKAEGGEHLDEAISNLEKKTKSEESHLGNAMARLQNKSGKADAKNGGSGSSPVEGLALQIYKGQITTQIYGNWSYPTAISNKKAPEAVVILKVREDGTILQSIFKKKSNDSIFDQSVTKAIEKSNPLLPLPEGLGSYEEIEVTFNLEKLKEN